MDIIKKNLSAGEITVKAINQEDLWFLSQLVNADDLVSGKTERKIKIGGADDDRNAKVVRKQVFMVLRVEKVEFHKDREDLRIAGVVIEGPEDVPHGSHHTFSVEQGTVITIKKESWPAYQLAKLKEAVESLGEKKILVLFDREEAIFALLKSHGHEIIATIKGEVTKKALDEGSKKDFYSEIAAKIKELDSRLAPKNIILASPGFWKDYLLKELPDELRGKTLTTVCSDVSESAISEVLKRPELGKNMENDRSSRELIQIDDLLRAISKQEACYGLAECEEKINIGAVKELFVSYRFIEECREKGSHSKVERLMKLAEKMNSKVEIISTPDADRKLHGLGGIAGILRWKQ